MGRSHDKLVINSNQLKQTSKNTYVTLIYKWLQPIDSPMLSKGGAVVAGAHTDICGVGEPAIIYQEKADAYGASSDVVEQTEDQKTVQKKNRSFV